MLEPREWYSVEHSEMKNCNARIEGFTRKSGTGTWEGNPPYSKNGRLQRQRKRSRWRWAAADKSRSQRGITEEDVSHVLERLGNSKWFFWALPLESYAEAEWQEMSEASRRDWDKDWEGRISPFTAMFIVWEHEISTCVSKTSFTKFPHPFFSFNWQSFFFVFLSKICN